MALLSRVSVPFDEHAVYILAAYAIYGNPEKHTHVRKRVESAFGDRGRWKEYVHREWDATGSILGDGVALPSDRRVFRVAACLLTECYQVGVALFESQARNPSAVWKPGRVDDRTRFVHLIMGPREAILVIASVNGVASGTTNRLVEELPLEFTLPPPGTSPYKLVAFNEHDRIHQVLGYFVPVSSAPGAIHVLPVETSSVNGSLHFFVSGCTEVAQRVFIYAVQSGRAQLIARWDVDFCNPRVVIKEGDEAIVIVPAEDEHSAARIASSSSPGYDVVNNKPTE